MSSLHPESLTWTALLGRWVEFAQASLALPDDAEGDAWRACTTPIITLQAVTFALGDLERVPAADRPLARDRAELLIEANAGAIHEAWSGQPLPPMLVELTADARTALEAAAYVGITELIWSGADPMIMPALDPGEPHGTLLLMAPGTLVMPGEPVAWWVDRAPLELDGCETRLADGPRQIYRQLDGAGRFVRDVIAPLHAEVPAGLPLLVPLFDAGEVIGHFPMDADSWLAAQRAAMTGETLDVDEVGDE